MDELELLRITVKEQAKEIKQLKEQAEGLKEEKRKRKILRRFYNTIREKKLLKRSREKLREKYRKKYGEDYDSYPTSK